MGLTPKAWNVKPTGDDRLTLADLGIITASCLAVSGAIILAAWRLDEANEPEVQEKIEVVEVDTLTVAPLYEDVETTFGDGTVAACDYKVTVEGEGKGRVLVMEWVRCD